MEASVKEVRSCESEIAPSTLLHTPKSAPGMPILQPQKRVPKKGPQMNPCPRRPTNGVPRRPPKTLKWTPREDPKWASEMAPKRASEMAPNWVRRKIDS